MTQDRFDRWLRRPGRIVLVAVAAVIGLAACGERTVEAAKQTGPASPEQELAARLQAEAARGDAAAQVNLGVMHVRGEGVPRNIAKAVDLFRRAAAQGNAAAQVNLGLMYANGEGVPRNINRAQELLQQAAAQGNADAEVNLGLMHVRGELGPKDLTKAHDLFHRAAVQGQPLAQNNLGLITTWATTSPRTRSWPMSGPVSPLNRALSRRSRTGSCLPRSSHLQNWPRLYALPPGGSEIRFPFANRGRALGAARSRSLETGSWRRGRPHSCCLMRHHRTSETQ